ncbi:hydantoinase/oxoprolinase family protein [Acidobacteriota bacterium]
MKERVRIGVDTGGTFTDFFIVLDKQFIIKKVPSTPQNPSLAILLGIRDILAQRASPTVIHGTTVATNSLLEHKGGNIALVTTQGFEDIIFIGRQTRRQLYSLTGEKRITLLSPRLCFGADERITSEGKVAKKLTNKEIKRLCDVIQRAKSEAVAVCLIHSYANPTHEEMIGNELDKRKIMVSVSNRLLREHREYERTSATAVNAFLMPVMSQYLEDLEEKLPGSDLRIMQSNEGHISPRAAKEEPLRTALSGPAGGVVAASHLGKSAGYRNIITFDMGGTSSDVSLIEGQIKRTNESLIGDFPVRLPMIDIHTVGSGGGSIAYKDEGGALRVGPESAGAEPGPACYGTGLRPTVTDANLFLGRLVPEFFLGGQMAIYPERSLTALRTLGQKLGKTPGETAEGIVEIANANMEKAIRVISIERGFDPRSFSLFSFGGAGGMHAAEMAEHLGMKNVIIPKNAGVLSAIGLLLADSIKDYSYSILKETHKIKKGELERVYKDLKLRGVQDMKREGFEANNLKITPQLDFRYLGQSYEIPIPVRPKNFDCRVYAAQFHKEHQKLYSYQHPDRPVEIVNFRIKIVGRTNKIQFAKFPFESSDPQEAFVKKQKLLYKTRSHKVAVFDRAKLAPGNIIHGPALVVEHESTTFLPPAAVLRVDAFTNLIIERHI